ncbi:MAG: hypothetical protein ABR881_23550 [Candidatus Sulfotelmatobacter sp.]|jgi:hypothetical protein
MNRPTEVFVLTRLVINPDGHVVSKNIGCTFDIFEADSHRAQAVENDFERYPITAEWLEEAEQSSFVLSMRQFRSIIEDMQRESLR